MTTGQVFIATSLDGFIARPDGAIDWLGSAPSSGEDHGYDAFIASVDGLIMGRGTFHTVMGFGDWPYHKPVVVLSRSLDASAVPEGLRDRVRISAAKPEEIMAEVAADGWKRAYVDGGEVIQSFLRAGLIADMILTRIPVLIGQGRPLFGRLTGDQPLRHIETHAFPSGLVQSRYAIAP